MGRAALPLSGSMQSGGSPKWEGQRCLYLGLSKGGLLICGKGAVASIWVYPTGGGHPKWEGQRCLYLSLSKGGSSKWEGLRCLYLGLSKGGLRQMGRAALLLSGFI